MMAPEPLCVGVVKTGNSATVSGPQLEVETPHPASARVGWECDEGVDGKYTCAQCGVKPVRSWFLIEQEDLEGNLCVEYDLEGRLYGRCYGCCRGRGKYKGPEDIYADLVDTHDEETLANIFRRECNKRHNKRSDVKNNEHALLKIKDWKELLAAIIATTGCLHE